MLKLENLDMQYQICIITSLLFPTKILFLNFNIFIFIFGHRRSTIIQYSKHNENNELVITI